MLHGGITMTTVVEGGSTDANTTLRQAGITVRLLDRGQGKHTLELSNYWDDTLIEAYVSSVPEPNSVKELLSKGAWIGARRISLLPMLPALEVVNFSNCNFELGDVGFGPLSELMKLKILHLPSCNLWPKDLESLRSDSIKQLNLFGNRRLVDKCIEPLKNNLPNLEKIVIGGTAISMDAAERVFGAGRAEI